MRTRLSRAVMAAAAGLAVTALLGCGQFSGLKAKMALKDANAAYGTQDYRKAIPKYEEAISLDPKLTQAYFYLANSYDNLWKPAKKGEAANDALLTKAIDGYKTAAEKSEDPKLKKLSLEYLVAAYRDKLEDPSQAEPVVERMIQMEPNEPTNYFALVEDLRGCRQVRGGGGDARQGPRRPAERPDRLHAAGRLLQPPGPVRQDHRVARGTRGQGAEQPGVVLHHRDLLLGQGVPRLPPQGTREARVRAEGHRRRRTAR